MKLTKISARNFKGLSFDLDLPAGVIITGPNFVGKSARTDAIRLLLLGHLPELGKQARSTFGLSSAREMEVWGTFNNLPEIRRRWFLKGDSVKTADNLEENPWFNPEGFAVMLHAETYFALSETERTKYVFGLLPPNSVDSSPVKFLELLRAALKERDPGAVEALILEADAAILPSVETAGPQSYFETFLALTVERSKAFRAESVRMDKTVQGLAQLRAADEVDGAGVNELEDRIAVLTRAITELGERKARFSSGYDQMVKDRGRRREIAAELARLKLAVADVGRDKARLATAQEALDREPAAMTPDAVTALRNELSTFKMDLAMTVRDIADGASIRDAALKQLHEIGLENACPYCGAVGHGWKVFRTAELEARVSTCDSKEVEFLKTRESLKAAVTEKEGALTRDRASATRRQALEREEQAVLRLIASAAPAEARGTALGEEAARLMSDVPELTAVVETIQTELNVKTEELRGLSRLRGAAAARGAELTRLAEAEELRGKALAGMQVADQAVEEIRRIQAAAVEAAFLPLLRSANELFGGILPTPIAYHNGEIGTWRAGVWVGHRTFSGTEKALTYAAIQIALSVRNPNRLMILDELGRLDTKNKLKVIDRVQAALKDGTLDQFVGIDASIEAYKLLEMSGELALQIVNIA